jgi:hypothetical protein
MIPFRKLLLFAPLRLCVLAKRGEAWKKIILINQQHHLWTY